jgi:hypothetical protein
MFRSKANVAKHAPSPPPLAKRKAVKTDILGTPQRSNPIQPVKYKFSLDRLLEDNNKALAVEEDLKRAESLIEEAENKKKKAPVDKRVLVAAAAELAMGEDGSGRLLAAMDRKDAWRINDAVWEFFDHKLKATSKDQRPFPVAAMKDHPTFTLVES